MERDEWRVVSLPAIAEEDESHLYTRLTVPLQFERKAGEALHPERDPLETLERIKSSIGEYNFQSQYQQRPMPMEGNLIKREWLRYYDVVPQNATYVVQSWDTANKSGELNDFSVCTTWLVVSQDLYLVDVFRKRLTFPQLKQAVVGLFEKYQPYKVLIEDKASGTSLIQDLQSAGVFGIEAYKPAPGSDKLMRFAAQSIKFESGKVHLPSGAPWLDEYIREITGFPGGKHDDQVDSTSQALDFLTTLTNGLAIWAALGRACGPQAYETC